MGLSPVSWRFIILRHGYWFHFLYITSIFTNLNQDYALRHRLDYSAGTETWPHVKISGMRSGLGSGSILLLYLLI